MDVAVDQGGCVETIHATTHDDPVYVIDDENDTTGVTFKVDAFSSLNAAPVVDQVEKVTVINSAGEQTITLTGIGDGDATSQVLTITAESSNDTILPGPVVNYTQGESTTDLVFTPLTDTAGPVIITVTISDDGGTVDNDGDKTTVMVFELESVTPPVKGYVMDLTMPDALSYFRPEGLNEFYWLDIVDTLGTQALRVKYIEKWTFGGIWFELPQELDLSNMPVVSYCILSVGN